jgi:hypothetical protein
VVDSLFLPALAIRPANGDGWTMDVHAVIPQTATLRRFPCRSEALAAGLRESRARCLPLFELDRGGRSVLLFDPQRREEICSGFDL